MQRRAGLEPDRAAMTTESFTGCASPQRGLFPLQDIQASGAHGQRLHAIIFSTLAPAGSVGEFIGEREFIFWKGKNEGKSPLGTSRWYFRTPVQS